MANKRQARVVIALSAMCQSSEYGYMVDVPTAGFDPFERLTRRTIQGCMAKNPDTETETIERLAELRRLSEKHPCSVFRPAIDQALDEMGWEAE